MQAADAGWSDGLLESGFGDAQIAAAVSWDARITRMIEVEAALARALGGTGLLPEDAVAAIVDACDPQRIDRDELARAAAAATTPVVPLVRLLAEGAEPLVTAHLHHGATSQDIVDTATVLQIRDALALVETSLLAVGDRCAELAEMHRHDVMAGRTLGQHAVPITFGLKAARWLGSIDRRIEQLRWVRPRVLTVQLGGAAGSLAVYGSRGDDVVRALADELGLAVPDTAWHAERDRIVELAGMLAAVVTTVEDVAGDLFLLAQNEIDEAREAAGEGPQSSAMPHKRNPGHVIRARAASQLALGELSVLTSAAGRHEHERAAGAWQAEWVALPSALARVGGAVTGLADALSALHFDGDRAERNLAGSLGTTGSEALSTALASTLGRRTAQQLTSALVAAAIEQGRPLVEVTLDDAEAVDVLGRDGIIEVLEVGHGLASVDGAIDRALTTHRTTSSGANL